MSSSTAGLIGGTGEEGRGVALRLAAAGVEVAIGSRQSERAQAAAEELNGQLGVESIRGCTNQDLFERCRILFLCVPFAHAEGTLEQLKDEFRPGQILVDVTVPLFFRKGPRLLQLEEGSGSERLRRIVPQEIPMVAAFKTLPAHLLCHAHEPLDCDEFICADSQDAKRDVLQLVQRIEGLRWVDAGPLRYCRALEAMTMLAIGINRRYRSKEGRYRFLGA